MWVYIVQTYQQTANVALLEVSGAKDAELGSFPTQLLTRFTHVISAQCQCTEREQNSAIFIHS